MFLYIKFQPGRFCGWHFAIVSGMLPNKVGRTWQRWSRACHFYIPQHSGICFTSHLLSVIPFRLPRAIKYESVRNISGIPVNMMVHLPSRITKKKTSPRRILIICVISQSRCRLCYRFCAIRFWKSIILLPEKVPFCETEGRKWRLADGGVISTKLLVGGSRLLECFEGLPRKGRFSSPKVNCSLASSIKDLAGISYHLELFLYRNFLKAKQFSKYKTTFSKWWISPRNFFLKLKNPRGNLSGLILINFRTPAWIRT